MAWAKPSLTVYTYDSFISSWGAGPLIKQKFEAQCACHLRFVSAVDGVALLNRLRMEGAKTKADIVLGLDFQVLAAAAQTQLFAPHALNTQALRLPIAWEDEYFVPFNYGYLAFIYDKTKVTPPTSMKALVDHPNQWRIIYSDPRVSTPGLGLIAWVKSIYGDAANVAWQKLSPKTVTVTQGWTEAYGLFLKGESDLVLSYTTSPAYHAIEEKDERYQAASFSEGHYLQMEFAAKLKRTGQNPETAALANQFLQFILTPAFQSEIPTHNWMYPVIDLPLPAAYQKLIKPSKVLAFPSDVLAKSRQDWVRQWQRAVP